jgi:hypothetical protein
MSREFREIGASVTGEFRDVLFRLIIKINGEQKSVGVRKRTARASQCIFGADFRRFVSSDIIHHSPHSTPTCSQSSSLSPSRTTPPFPF